MWLIALFSAATAAVPCDPRALPDLEVVGPGSHVAGADELAVIDGIWRLTCTEGAGWFPAARRRTFGSAFDGAVLTPQDPAVLACYQSACSLPEGLCLVVDDLGARAVVCGHTAPATTTQWTARRLLDSAGRDAARRAWEEAVALPEPPPPAPVSVAPAPEARVASTPAVTSPSTVLASASPAAATTAAPSPWTAAPAVSPPPPPARRVDLAAAVQGFELPPSPPSPCPPPTGRRDAALAQVDLGDEKRVAGDVHGALGHYRAALAVDTCNGHAWGAIGSLLMEGGRTADAERALAVSARLVPQNVRAWAELGRARESLGQVEGAIAAYHEALSRQDDYAPAAAGLQRVTHRP